MSKILGSWSGMRKYLETEMLAPSLKGRIRYHCTAYPGTDGSHVFEIHVNGEKIKSFALETVNSYFLQSGLKEIDHPWGTAEYWSGFFAVLDAIPLAQRPEYTDDEFCKALEIYRNQPIDESLSSIEGIENNFFPSTNQDHHSEAIDI